MFLRTKRGFLKMALLALGGLIGCSIPAVNSPTMAKSTDLPQQPTEEPQPSPQITEQTQPTNKPIEPSPQVTQPIQSSQPTAEPSIQVTNTQVNTPSSSTRQKFSGSSLSGWETVLGDAIYAAPGEPAVNINDIEAVHFADHSELRANILVRKVMAHNITFIRITDDKALTYVIIGKYKFRLLFLPSTSNVGLNGETLEGHLSVWDGSQTKKEYLVAFQWVLNPWSDKFKSIQTWDNPGVWKPTGKTILPDLSWHEVQMILDPGSKYTQVMIDGIVYPSQFVTMSHPDWGSDVSIRLAAEIVSLFPGDQGDGALHKAEFKDWSLVLDTHNAYLPVIGKPVL
jgi:hypothetical protein